MNNEEKKQFLIDAHNEYMNARPYDGDFTLEEKKIKEDAFWERYLKLFEDRIPQKLYKYRTFSLENLDAIENDYAWFSMPSEFGDIVDSALNTDIESELYEIEKNRQVHIKKISSAFINLMLASCGKTVDENMIDLALPLFNENAEVSEKVAKNFLGTMLPEYASDQYAKILALSTQLGNQALIKDEIEGFLNAYMDFNNRIRNDSIAFCLAEENDNLAMWETYASGASGFCIVYTFPDALFLSQRMLLNLFPIYYGEKPHIKFFDVLLRGIQSKQQINGITYEDYESWFLSAFTKDPSYTFQKEWRIVFSKDMGDNKQPFPFARSIILGEKMSSINRNTLIDLAKKKGLRIYQRKLKTSGAKVVTEEI